LFREFNSFRIRLAVDELKRIDRDHFAIEFFKLTVVEKHSQPFAGADPEVIIAVFTNLECVFELTCKQVRFTPFAFNEDVLRVYYTFFGWDCFDSFGFLVEPSHRNAGKRSTNRKSVVSARLELDPLLRANASRKWMLNLLHLRHEIGGFDQLRRRITARDDDVQRGL